MDYYASKALGQTDSMIVTDTATYTGTWSFVEALTDTVFATFTTNVTKNSPSTLAVAADWANLTAGEKRFAKITAVKLTSGSVRLYK